MEGYTNYQWNESGNSQQHNFYQSSPKSEKNLQLRNWQNELARLC